jgi:hypothetical protein
MLKAAEFYISHGLSVIPCKDKRPTIPWKDYQHNIMDDPAKHFTQETPQIAMIAGIVSGGLEVIDFDIKHLAPMDRELFWNGFNNQLLELSPEIFRKITVHKTQSGGYHILYRCEEIEGNKKLAKIKVKDKYECIIETRGEGGYIIAPPSQGYENITGELNLSVLDTEERAIIIGLCKSYNEEPNVALPEKKTRRDNTNFKKSPFDDYNECDEVLTVLKNHGWTPVQDAYDKIFFRRPGSENFQSANWCRKKKIFYVFSPADPILSGPRGFNASQVYTLLQHKGDYKEAFKTLLKEGFGTPWTNEERAVIDQAKTMVAVNTTPERIKAEIKATYPNWYEKDIDLVFNAAMAIGDEVFWYLNDKGSLMIDNLSYLHFLHNTLGFALWSDSTEAEKPLIKINRITHMVERISTDDVIKQHVTKWLYDNIEDLDTSVTAAQVNSALIKSDNKIFARKFYEWLPCISFNTFNDTVDYAYFFFKNGIVQISADDINMTRYEDLNENTFIWKDRIRAKDFDIKMLGQDDIYLSPSYQYNYKEKESNKIVKGTGSAWYKYIRRISGIGPEFDETIIDNLPKEHQDRMLSTMTIIGYLLHSYKDPSRPWAVIINEDTPDDGKGGGSGKQIFTKGLAMLRNLKEEDGRQLNIKAQFAFQGLSEEHDLYVLDDVPKWFRIDTMYRMITNDTVIEERNKGRKIIPFDQSPKFVFSTNYDISGTEDAKHLKRRVKQLLFECYFGPNRLPINEIGMVLKDGWIDNDDQWQLFYNFMFLCVLSYLNLSVIETQMTEKTKEKAIRNQFGNEFYEFVSENLNDETEWYKEWFVVKPFYTVFKDNSQTKMTLSEFKKNLESYLKIYEIKYDIDKNYTGKSSYQMDQNTFIEDGEYYRKQMAIRVLEN